MLEYTILKLFSNKDTFHSYAMKSNTLHIVKFPVELIRTHIHMFGSFDTVWKIVGIPSMSTIFHLNEFNIQGYVRCTTLSWWGPTRRYTQIISFKKFVPTRIKIVQYTCYPQFLLHHYNCCSHIFRARFFHFVFLFIFFLMWRIIISQVRWKEFQ